jgi:hypothetical protein
MLCLNLTITESFIKISVIQIRVSDNRTPISSSTILIYAQAGLVISWHSGSAPEPDSSMVEATAAPQNPQWTNVDNECIHEMDLLTVGVTAAKSFKISWGTCSLPHSDKKSDVRHCHCEPAEHFE